MRRRLLSVLAAGLILAALSPLAGAIPPSSEAVTEGIDVSVYQGAIDFAAVRGAGIETVYIRSSYGEDGVDSYFRAHYQGARDAGLRIGFYHYLTARDEAGARAQARFFASLLDGLDYDCRPAMDFEALDGLTAQQASAIAVAFLEELEARTGHSPVVYSDDYNAGHVFDASVARWPLWAAAYGPAEPEVDAHWTSWVGFQYTDRGVLPGISGYVDRDRFTDGVLLEPAPGPAWFSYTVRPGDTLWALARRYHTTVAELADLNSVADPNLIYVGQILRIPADGDGYLTYTIRPGDTLWAIARTHGTTVAALAELNHIANPNLIYAGDTLRIPV